MFKVVYVVICILAFSVLSQAKSTALQTTKASKTTTAKVTAPPKVHTYTVVKVADGDTITILNNTDKNQVRVRFLCIDAPEKSQAPWGEQSLKKLAELLPLKSEVTLNGSVIDLYGRTVAEVITAKGVNVNKKMTELGLVIHYPFQKGCNHYQDLENKAKKDKKGVWSDSKFEKPWDYRKRMGIGARGKDYHHSTTTAVANAKSSTTKHSKLTSTEKPSKYSKFSKTTTAATTQSSSSSSSTSKPSRRR